MIFPRNKIKHEVPAPWWQPPAARKSSKGNAVLIAVLAGSIGGVLGVNASGGDLFNRVQLVSSTSTIQRAPDSVAGIAQRVLPSVVSISTRSIDGAGTGSGFVIDSNGFIWYSQSLTPLDLMGNLTILSIMKRKLNVPTAKSVQLIKKNSPGDYIYAGNTMYMMDK